MMESLLWFVIIPKNLGSLTNQNLDTTREIPENHNTFASSLIPPKMGPISWPLSKNPLYETTNQGEMITAICPCWNAIL